MTDASLFTSGALFTQDYLVEGIADTAQYRGVAQTAREVSQPDGTHGTLPLFAPIESAFVLRAYRGKGIASNPLINWRGLRSMPIWHQYAGQTAERTI
jgi:hypothetical protein